MKLVYLPPYSPDLNPIKEFFTGLKSFIRLVFSPMNLIRIKDSIIFSNVILIWLVQGMKAQTDGSGMQI